MFSFIKAIQNLLSELKKRKGLWFTTLSVLSILGISLSMYLLTSMTKGVAKEVYVNMSSVYKSSLEHKLQDRQKDYRKLVLGLKTNDNFKNNLNNKPLIDGIINNYNRSLVEEGFDSINLIFYTTINQTNQYRNSVNTAINRKIPSFGIEILPYGPGIVYLEPIMDGENILGVVEVRENILSLKKDFERNRQGIFLFLIQEKMMANLSVEAKDGNYRPVVEDLRVEEKRYDGSFFSDMMTEGVEGFKEFKHTGYSVNELYFKTYKEISDINGVIVGYIILGEKVQGSGAFVNIVDNMTKTVTTVALGLVISILLFMF
uniref:hypothetical protein n=1 Tax=Aliarcobacter sp. TaxID=2321116 RepID=UPI0040483392